MEFEGKSILVVEDNEALNEQLVEYVSLFFPTVFTCTNVKDALVVYRTTSPDIILTDINMPETNGLEFIKDLREKGKQTPIIILSAYTTTDYLLQAVELNLVTYLTKPIESEKFKSALFKAVKQLSVDPIIHLLDGYVWHTDTKALFVKKEQVELTRYENTFLEVLFTQKNTIVSYENLHYYIYGNKEFSLEAIKSLVKRIRKKVPKSLIQSSYKEGYKIQV